MYRVHNNLDTHDCAKVLSAHPATLCLTSYLKHCVPFIYRNTFIYHIYSNKWSLSNKHPHFLWEKGGQMPSKLALGHQLSYIYQNFIPKTSFLELNTCTTPLHLHVSEYEGHFRSYVNVIILVYSMSFTSKAVYHRKRQPLGVRTELISMMHNSHMHVRTC